MTYTVKAVLKKGQVGGEKEIRRFEVDASGIEDEFGHLKGKIYQLFPSLSGEFQFYWKDEENDFITLSNNDELAEAKKCMNEGLLRVFIKESKPTQKEPATGNENHHQDRGFHWGPRGGVRHPKGPWSGPRGGDGNAGFPGFGPWGGPRRHGNPWHGPSAPRGENERPMRGWWRRHRAERTDHADTDPPSERPSTSRQEAGDSTPHRPHIPPRARKMFRQMMMQWWIKNKGTTAEQEQGDEFPSSDDIRKMKRRWWKRMQDRMQTNDVTEGEEVDQNEAGDVSEEEPIILSDTDDQEIEDEGAIGTDIEPEAETADGEQREDAETGEESDEELLMRMRMRCGGRGRGRRHHWRNGGRKAFRQMMREKFREMRDEDNSQAGPATCPMGRMFGRNVGFSRRGGFGGMRRGPMGGHRMRCPDQNRQDQAPGCHPRSHMFRKMMREMFHESQPNNEQTWTPWMMGQRFGCYGEEGSPPKQWKWMMKMKMMKKMMKMKMMRQMMRNGGMSPWRQSMRNWNRGATCDSDDETSGMGWKKMYRSRNMSGQGPWMKRHMGPFGLRRHMGPFGMRRRMRPFGMRRHMGPFGMEGHTMRAAAAKSPWMMRNMMMNRAERGCHGNTWRMGGGSCDMRGGNGGLGQFPVWM